MTLSLLHSIPKEVIIDKILVQWLGDVLDLLRLSLVCKRFHSLASNALQLISTLSIHKHQHTHHDLLHHHESGDGKGYDLKLMQMFSRIDMTKLTVIAFVNLEILIDEHLEMLANNSPNVQALTILRCNKVVNSVFCRIDHGNEELLFEDGLLMLECDCLPIRFISTLIRYKKLTRVKIGRLPGYIGHAVFFATINMMPSVKDLRLFDGKDLDIQTTGLMQIVNVDLLKRLERFGITGTGYGHVHMGYLNVNLDDDSDDYANLKEFIVEGPIYDSLSAKKIAMFTEMEKLSLGERCSNIGDAGLQLIAHTFVNLKYINMSNVSHFGFSLFAEHCHSLETLIATECKGVGDLTLLHLGERCQNLRYLDVAGCKGVTDQGVVALCARSGVVYRNLTFLNLSRCTDITNEGLKAAGNCLKLKYLFMSGIYRLTDGGVIQFAEKIVNLYKIDLSYCYKLTILSLEILLEKCFCLLDMKLEGCSNLPDSDRELLEIRRKQKAKGKFVLAPARSTVKSESTVAKKPSIKKKAVLPDFDEILNSGSNVAPIDLKQIEKQMKLLKAEKKSKKLEKAKTVQRK